MPEIDPLRAFARRGDWRFGEGLPDFFEERFDAAGRPVVTVLKKSPEPFVPTELHVIGDSVVADVESGGNYPMGHSQSMHSDRHQFATNAGIDFGIIE